MGHTHRYKFSFEKKYKVKSPSICPRTPKPVRIRQSGRTGVRGVTCYASVFAREGKSDFKKFISREEDDDLVLVFFVKIFCSDDFCFDL